MALHRKRPDRQGALWKKSRAWLVGLLLAWPVADLWLLAAADTPEDAADLDLNFGVFRSLSATQARKGEKTDPSRIVPLTDPIVQGSLPRPGVRADPGAPYTIRN